MSDTAGIERLTYTFRETCTVLGVSERIVRQLMRRQDNPLPVIRSTARGSRILVSREALREWLKDASGQEGGPNPTVTLLPTTGSAQKSSRR